jgi:hypothetical protein
MSLDFHDDGLSHPRFPHVGVECVPQIVECESALNLAGPIFAPMALVAGLVGGGIFLKWNFFETILTIINKAAQTLCQFLLFRVSTGIGSVGFLFFKLTTSFFMGVN